MGGYYYYVITHIHPEFTNLTLCHETTKQHKTYHLLRIRNLFPFTKKTLKSFSKLKHVIELIAGKLKESKVLQFKKDLNVALHSAIGKQASYYCNSCLLGFYSNFN